MVPERTVQRNSQPVFGRVNNAMQPDLITDIGHLIRLICCILFDLQGSVVVIRRGGMIDRFVQLPIEDLHDTVRVGVVMDE
jgi:hypothetical protein